MQTTTNLTARLDEIVGQSMKEFNTPGVAVALTDRAETIEVRNYGFADIAASRPVDDHTLFEIGSIGKSFTAICLLQLHGEGRLDLHAPPSRYLPWFEVPSDFQPFAIHHLLSHTAGIVRGTDFALDPRYEVWALRETETAWTPGERFHYSNDGYKALGLVLTSIEGAPYQDVVRNRILQPLGMTETDPIITNQTRTRLAVGYQPWYDDRPWSPRQPLAPAPWLETNTADGCIASTADDMAAYVRMFLNRGHPQVLSADNLALMTHPISTMSDSWSYGYGLMLGQEDGHTLVGHGGGMVGYFAMILADLEAGRGVVVLVNGPGSPMSMAENILRLLRADAEGHELPAPVPATDGATVENLGGYAGTYTGNGRAFTIRVDDEGMILEDASGSGGLTSRGPDLFDVDHPEYSSYRLRFGRSGDTVVEAFHGPDWYANERYTGPRTFDYPERWNAYPGHYRSYNPWLSNFRVFLRKGELVMNVGGAEEPLFALDGATFSVGEEQPSPERLSFDTVVDGVALRAAYGSCAYYRFFTP